MLLLIGWPALAACQGRIPAESYVLDKTDSDILVRKKNDNSEIVFSARRWIEEGRRAFERSNADRPLHCDFQHRIQVISLVGPFLGLRDAASVSCLLEAHPAEETRLLTLDVSIRDRVGDQPGTPVSLDALFPAEALKLALSRAPLIRALLPNEEPPNLEELLHAITGQYGAGPDDCFYVPRDLLRRFVLLGTQESGAVIVVLGLPGAGPCRTNLTKVRLALAAPSDLRSALNDAASQRVGFFSEAGRPRITIRSRVNQSTPASKGHSVP